MPIRRPNQRRLKPAPVSTNWRNTRDRAEELTNKDRFVLEETENQVSEAISKTGKKAAKG
jgi:hypothetical protein